MKPINCAFCGYAERVNLQGDDICFCMKSNRIIDKLDKRPEDCPLDERLKDTADTKGFYLVEG